MNTMLDQGPTRKSHFPICNLIIKLFSVLILVPLSQTLSAATCESPEEDRSFTVDATYTRDDRPEVDTASYKLWFKFDAIPDAIGYSLKVEDLNIPLSPSPVGRTFLYDVENQPTSITTNVMHKIDSYSIGVYVAGSGVGLSNDEVLADLDAFYSGIVGEATVTFECDEFVDVNLLASHRIEKRGDVHYVHITGGLTNIGKKDAENVQVKMHYLPSQRPGDFSPIDKQPGVPRQLHVTDISPGGYCSDVTSFVGGALLCEGIRVAGRGNALGRDYFDITISARITNVADVPELVYLEAIVPEDVDDSGNEDHVRIRPEFKSGSVEQTRQAMEVLDDYFDYETDKSGSRCDLYQQDIYGRFEEIRRDHPEVFADLSYGPVSSTFGAGSSAGHSGMVVYQKGTNYHETGVIIHGTPSASPYSGSPGNFDTWLGKFVSDRIPDSIKNQGTSTSGLYHRTPTSLFQSNVRSEEMGCGFEGSYTDNAGEFARTPPSCSSIDNAQLSGNCSFAPSAVVIKTNSPVDLVVTNHRGQTVETIGGQVVTQELDQGIHSMSFPHDDGTFGWVLVLPEDDYDVKLMGVGDGPYKLTITTFDDLDEPVDAVYEGVAQTGMEESFTVAAAHLAEDTDNSPVQSEDDSDNVDGSSDTDGEGSGSGGGALAELVLILSALILARRLRGRSFN